jgi:gluconate:H+ symporter, GntP family
MTRRRRDILNSIGRVIIDKPENVMNTSQTARATFQRPAISLPQPVWLILLALGLGLAHGLGASALIKAFGAGFGRALGDFALILIPSFVLAACLARQTLSGAPRVASAIAPVTAAGMVCPDTAYAALASVAKHRKLSVAFGSYAGYRLLFPAGPLIVATGLGIDSGGLLAVGLALLIPVWLTGELWARFRSAAPAVRDGQAEGSMVLSMEMLRALAPLAVLAVLLILGGLLKPVAFPLIDFITRPKGALLIAAALAVWMTDAVQRRECLDSAMSRSASLLLVVGAASAFGLMLTTVFPIAGLVPNGTTGVAMLFVLFAVTAVFKITHGSSTVTLATVTPVLAPVILAAGVSPAAAVFAVCLGSMVIIPTDSYYWLVRSDALAHASERSAIITLGGGAALQAIAGLLALMAASALRIV